MYLTNLYITAVKYKLARCTGPINGLSSPDFNHLLVNDVECALQIDYYAAMTTPP
jgi:hypothetical protein